MRETPFWGRLLKAAAVHAAAGGIVVGLALALVTFAYFGLLAWAVVTGSGVGGPFALVATIVATLLTMFVVVVALLWPVTVIAALLCDRVLKWPRVVQIPVSAALLFVAVFGAMVTVNYQVQPGEPVSWRIALATWIALLPALSVYWWVLQVPRLLSRIVAYFHIQRSGF